jgi:hypothetical protein
MAWRELPAGEAIALAPGNSYAVVASVKANHTRADVLELLQGKGLAVFDYAEQGERAGLGPDPRTPRYRAIALEAVAARAGEVPWSVPFPASVVDGSSIVKAWTAPPGPPPPAPAPPRAPLSAIAPVDLRPLGVLVAGVGAWKAWDWWRGRRRRR